MPCKLCRSNSQFQNAGSKAYSLRSVWWCLDRLGCIFFIFTPSFLGRWSNLTSMFFKWGWFNHQLVEFDMTVDVVDVSFIRDDSSFLFFCLTTFGNVLWSPPKSPNCELRISSLNRSWWGWTLYNRLWVPGTSNHIDRNQLKFMCIYNLYYHQTFQVPKREVLTYISRM